MIKELKNLTLIAIGILLSSTGLHGFLLSSNFIDGGVTGVSMLLSKITGQPLWIWLPITNLPFLLLGLKTLGKSFCLRSVLAIAGLSTTLAFVHFPDFTSDSLLTAIFGGFFIGAGIGLTIRGQAVLDGTEIAALLLSKRSSLFKVGDLILIFNIILFLSAIKVLGTEPALYSIIAYISAAKTLDFVLYGLEAYTSISIISPKNTEIKSKLTETLERGVTIYQGLGGLSGAKQEILLCVVTRLEIGQVKEIINSVDPNAFVTLTALADVQGGRVKRKSFH